MEGAVGGVARCFEVTAKSLANLIPSFCGLPRGCRRRGDGAGANHAEERFLDGSSTRRPPRRCSALPIVHPAAGAAVARDLMLHAAVAERQLAAAAPAADQAGKQRITVLGRAMMPARGDVAGDHRADRFEPLPADITLMGARHQRQPLGAHLRRIFTLAPYPPATAVLP